MRRIVISHETKAIQYWRQKLKVVLVESSWLFTIKEKQNKTRLPQSTNEKRDVANDQNGLPAPYVFSLKFFPT